MKEKKGHHISNEKARYQLLAERLAGDPDLRERALSASPERFVALCEENGLKGISLD